MSKTTHMPLAPLETLARAKFARTNGGDFSDNNFAMMVGVSNRAIARWRAAGDRVPWQSADVAAINLGLHPALVWQEEWSAMDAGLLEGTDARAIKAVEEAVEEIGRLLDARAEAAVA